MRPDAPFVHVERTVDFHLHHVLAAHRAGIKTIILPKWNEKDLEDVPDNVKNTIEFRFVENMRNVLKIALNK